MNTHTYYPKICHVRLIACEDALFDSVETVLIPLLYLGEALAW